MSCRRLSQPPGPIPWSFFSDRPRACEGARRGNTVLLSALTLRIRPGGPGAHSQGQPGASLSSAVFSSSPAEHPPAHRHPLGIRKAPPLHDVLFLAVQSPHPQHQVLLIQLPPSNAPASTASPSWKRPVHGPHGLPRRPPGPFLLSLPRAVSSLPQTHVLCSLLPPP